jgi:hypothetical protein
MSKLGCLLKQDYCFRVALINVNTRQIEHCLWIALIYQSFQFFFLLFYGVPTSLAF